MVTVHDVAARAGVSIATVSRALRTPERVSEDTRERVLAAVRELGYLPNRAARSLRRGRTGLIAFVVPDIENPYFATLTKGAQTVARAEGYGLVVVDTAESTRIEADELRGIRTQVDGVIVVSSRLDGRELADLVTGAPCVLVNRVLPGGRVPTVTFDESIAATDAVAHLTELGHRRLAYVGGPARAWSETRRWGALRAAAQERHVAIVHLGHVTPDDAGGRAAAEAARSSGASAVIAFNDYIAIGLLAAWAQVDVRVPADLSLLGFDDTYLAALTSPPLTSVGADLHELGERAVRLLLARIEEPALAAGQAPVLIPRLTVRASTGPARGG